MEAHDEAVVRISTAVIAFYEQQKPFRLYHGSTNSTRASTRRRDNTIDTSSLGNILAIDVAKKTALVEPNVPLDLIVKEALKHGLVPPVVMEFPGITVGGGFSGTSGESSSFRHGAFDTTINEIEIVLPNGEVTRASKSHRQDIFWGAASAFGTLGVVTLLEMQLIEAKKYVGLTYYLETSMSEAVLKMEQECSRIENDYVDAIVFANDATIVCTGKLSDEVPKETPNSEIWHFTRRKDPWFYLRAQDVMKQLRKKGGSTMPITDYIPLTDYLFRYDRGGFWVARYAFKYFLTPFNRVTRRLLDPFLHAREMYIAVHQSGLADYYMVQDVGVPFPAVAEFQTWLDETFKIYPLWLCPLRIRRDDPDSAYGLHAAFATSDQADLMNFGIWAPLPGKSREEVIRLNRALEAKVQELGGKKWLYAQAFYTEEEFWKNYDRGSYDALRENYEAQYLPSVYDKIKTDLKAEEYARKGTLKRRIKSAVSEVWPLRGLYGVYKVVGGGDYLLKKVNKHESPTGISAEKAKS